MKKEKQTNPLSDFPTEVLVYYFKKFRKCCHYEYEHLIYDDDNCLIDDPLIIEDVTTAPFTHELDYRDDIMYIRFEGMYWIGKCYEFMNELHKRGNVNISAKNFKDWKREYKKAHKYEAKRKEKTVLRK
jgi:hypothetical protein